MKVRNNVLMFLMPFLMFCSVCRSYAQCSTVNKAFQAGEDITYDLYFNWKFVWVKCGEAHYTIKSQNYNGQAALRNDLLFTSNKKCDAFFTMRDTLISYITPQLTPLYFRKGAYEGKNYTVDEVWYSYPNGKSHVKQNYLNRHGEWSEHHFESNECNYDMLSILSLARSFNPADYKVGQKILFPMTTGKKVEQQTLIYKGKKQWKANDGRTYRCLVFSLLDYEEGASDKELLRFYVTDDLNHLPVRIDFFLKFGSAKAFFVRGKGLRNPQTSIMK